MDDVKEGRRMVRAKGILQSQAQQSGKEVVLVTGASSGIGQAIASLLSEKGYSVFGTSRTPAGSLLELDVRSDISVKKCVEDVLEVTGHIDILVNNAGFALAGPAEETSIEQAKEQFDTNFFGAVRMANAVLPIMRKRKQGKIINISSIGGRIAMPFGAFYSASKFALEGYSEALSYAVEPFNIKVSVVEAGFFKTNIGNAFRKSVIKTGAYGTRAWRAVEIGREKIAKGGDPTLVADAVLHIARSRNPRLRYMVGSDAKLYYSLNRLLPEPLFRIGMRKYWKLDAND